MSQMALDLEPRRIDVTLDRLQQSLDAMSEQERHSITSSSQFNTIVIVAQLRAMERGEKEALPTTVETMADAYDRVAEPGEHAVNAIIRTFNAVYAARSEAA